MRIETTCGWADVYRDEAVRLTRLAVLLVGVGDAHDLVADAVLRAISSPRWNDVESQGAYLSRTLVNLAHERHRQLQRRRRREIRAERLRHHSSGEIDVERQVVVREVLSSLSVTQLAVVYLHYWEDATLEQVAAILGVGVGTVRTHLDRAKRRLRPLLSDIEKETIP